MRKEEESGRPVQIIGIGACVMDTLVSVPSYPKEDTKLRGTDSRSAGGGPVATGLAAAARLGASAGYVGVLAGDNGGIFLKEDFRKYGVATEWIDILPGYRSFSSVIWLAKDTATRTCVYDRGDLPPLKLNERMLAAVKAAEILMIDGNELEAAREACLAARESGVKVLYDCGGLYPGVERLLELTDVMIPSEEFAREHTGCRETVTAAEKLYARYRPEVVVVTCGKEGGVLYDGKELFRYPAFPVEAVDTNGAGDVFHGAFAAGMTRGFGYRECCYFASAVSALKCTGMGARESVPDFGTAERFLQAKGIRLKREEA